MGAKWGYIGDVLGHALVFHVTILIVLSLGIRHGRSLKLGVLRNSRAL